MQLNLHDCEFLISAVQAQQYPKYQLPEIALVGRSNVGKSSLINALVNRRNFARVSSQPGRTQTLNFYRIHKFGLVDLPGYGYAKVAQSVRKSWQPMIERYLTTRPNLVGVLQVVDIRHKPTEDDQLMAQWLRTQSIPTWVVATKADKISRGKYKPSLEQIMTLLQLPGIVFSAQTKLGKEQLLAVILEMVKTGSA